MQIQWNYERKYLVLEYHESVQLLCLCFTLESFQLAVLLILRYFKGAVDELVSDQIQFSKHDMYKIMLERLIMTKVNRKEYKLV